MPHRVHKFKIAIGSFLLVAPCVAKQPVHTYQPTVTDDSPPVHKKVPVTLALVHERYKQYPWDGLAIAQWLAAKGCDLKAHRADGTTLLHIAAAADDVPMVRFLLSQGLGASTPGKYGLPALGSAENEDVAMILLNAGTDFSMMVTKAASFASMRKAIIGHA